MGTPQVHVKERCVSRLALGSAQFGMPYGITNTNGQVETKAIGAILSWARNAGMDTLDTAIGYGTSQAGLGEVGVEGWNVVTKLPAIPDELSVPEDISQWVDAQTVRALSQLRLARVYGILLHQPLQLLQRGGSHLYASLRQLKKRGVTLNIGVSVYDPEELEQVINRFDFDMVQLPLNVLDRRFFHADWPGRLAALGIETHVRSVFLQGLLLMPSPETIPYFSPWRSHWARWREWLAASQVTPLQACLGFALGQSHVHRVIIGVTALQQLEEIVNSIRFGTTSAPSDLECFDSKCIDPRRWTL